MLTHLPLLIRVVVLPPVMFLLESKNLSNLAVTQRRLPLIHLPRNGRIRRILLKELLRRECSSDGIVRRIEDLEAQPILLYTQIANLAKITSINVRPSVPLADLRGLDILWEVTLVLVGLDDVADAERVDIGVEAAGESAGYSLAAEFGDGVGVHGVYVHVFR